MDTIHKKISFLLGSGFSVPANIPGVARINEYLMTLKNDDFIVNGECMAFPQSTKGNIFVNFGVESAEETHRLLIIIGYGFKDQGINDIIRLAKGEIIIFDIKEPAPLPFQSNEFVFIEKSSDKICYSDITGKLSEIWGEPS